MFYFVPADISIHISDVIFCLFLYIRFYARHVYRKKGTIWDIDIIDVFMLESTIAVLHIYHKHFRHQNVQAMLE